jgi:hypothetical protein
MGKEENGRQAESQEILVKCSQILRIARACARNEGLTGEEVEECARWFQARKLCQGFERGAFTEEELEKIKLQAASFARRYAFRLTRRRRMEVCDCDENGSLENGPAGKIASREPGPEEVVIMAERLQRLLLPLPEMTLNQQQLFVRRFLEEARLVDLVEETGRNAHALRTAVYTLRIRLRKLLEGKKMNTAEAAEYQSMLDRFHASD